MPPLLLRIAIIGPESTGKTTLTKALATHFQAPWVPEYAREYLNQLSRPYTKKDLWVIAQKQLSTEDALAAQAQPLLFCDTNLWVIRIWYEYKYNHCPKWIIQNLADRSYALYFLTDIDTPWVYDPLRENPAPEERLELFTRYAKYLSSQTTPYVRLSGTHNERLQKSIRHIKRLLAKHKL